MPASSKTQASVSLQERDLAVLRDLLESRILTAAHIAILHFSGKKPATRKRLQKLKSAGFIQERRRRVVDPASLLLTLKGFNLLRKEGILSEYPPFDQEKRARISDLTLRHELEVMDVKAAFHSAVATHPKLKIEEFTTWPILYQFESARNSYGAKPILVKPDGFIRLHEEESAESAYEHAFFLEVDRSSEVLDTLVSRASCYLEYYQSGGFAEWKGGSRDDPQKFPFRVLVVLKTAERRNNLAERLLQSVPAIFTHVWLTTFAEVKTNPFGKIWIRPRDYRDVTAGTPFDPERERKVWGYKRQTEREVLVEMKIKKIGILDQ